MSDPRYPSLYQINPVWLTELSRALGSARHWRTSGRRAGSSRGQGFDWIWFLSVWQTGPRRERSRGRIPNGVAISGRRCRTSRTKTSPGQVRDPETASIVIWRPAALAGLRQRLQNADSS